MIRSGSIWRIGILGCALVGPLAPGAAFSADPFDGRWALNTNWCVNEDDDGTDLVPIEIIDRKLTGYTYVCSIDSVEPVGTENAAWRVGVSCSGGGQEWQYESIYGLNRPRQDAPPDMLLEINLTDGSVKVWHHCEVYPH